MAEIMTARATLETGVRFDVEASSGHHVTLDASEQDGGQNAGCRPIEMLLVGLAGCTGMDVISILRKKRQQVTGYEVHVRGVRAETHPMMFVEITVEHIVTGYDIHPAAVERAIELSETRYCGAGAMLGKVAHITHTFRIIEAAESQPSAAMTQQEAFAELITR
ncbi:MAG TPA: OsmC family protein [Ktedonobacteraceae bacterium]|nr:OsmC family protein [Ktedonobacteraceae bacterium]